VTRDDLAALRAKYEEMLRLRLAHQAGSPSPEHADPRAVQRAMASLASRFPGALREIDDLPLEAIRARIADLRGAEDGGHAAPWMEATHLFHAFTRGALCAKRWLVDRKIRAAEALDDATRAAFRREAPALCWGADALEWADDLARLASPPRGRVTDLVYEKLAARLAAPEGEVRLLIFGMSRRQRRARSA
jgi:hypothetical protein